MTIVPTRHILFRCESAAVSILLFWVLGAPASAVPITISTVPVGNAGNANDPLTGNSYGGVIYDYRIGTTEVTVGQYTEFLNAVAATDTYLLYNPSMATEPSIAGIAQSGAPGSYTYSVIGSANHPVTRVSWGDAARFANWLQNGQPTGAQNASTTEDGAYMLNGATTDAAWNALSRNAGATWFIPTESEWYKAAYYQPAAQGGDSDSYWLYPMGANGVPYSDQPPGATPDNTQVANFERNDSLANGYNDGYAVTGSTSFSFSQNYLTDVGAYTSSLSFYGTFDQGGNVAEWNEAIIFGARGARGGSWFDSSNHLQTGSRGNSLGTTENNSVGFRMVAVPEPTTFALAALGFLGLMDYARRRAQFSGGFSAKQAKQGLATSGGLR